jgi:hypothetical protein
MNGCWAWITPKVASNLLALNTDNRRLRPHHKAEIASAMKSGLWDDRTPQLYVIDEQRHLADGQHRLEAIVDTGIPQWVIVCWDVPVIARINIDTGSKRSVWDNLHQSGQMDVCPVDTPDEIRWAVHLANAVSQGMRPNKANMTAPQAHLFFIEHQEALRFALGAFGKHHKVRAISRASVQAIVARAYYHVPVSNRSRLSEFADVMMTGLVANQVADAAAIKFREWLTKESGRNSNFNATIYARGAAALQAFLERRPLVMLRPVSTDPFPLPNESSNATKTKASKAGVPAIPGLIDRMAGWDGREDRGGQASHRVAAKAATAGSVIAN